jgi:hypothetical protein
VPPPSGEPPRSHPQDCLAQVESRPLTSVSSSILIPLSRHRDAPSATRRGSTDDAETSRRDE